MMVTRLGYSHAPSQADAREFMTPNLVLRRQLLWNGNLLIVTLQDY